MQPYYAVRIALAIALRPEKNIGKLEVFLVTEPLTAVCIDIPVKFIRRQRRNEYLFVITDRSTKLSRHYP